MASKEQELAIRIAGKVDSSLKGALGAAGSGIKNLSKTIATATAAATAAVGAVTAAAIDVGKEFEKSMSQVEATMLIDKTTSEGIAAYETLEEAARECGRTTAFSATEAAEGLNYLALAGYDADQAAAALPTVLKLAGAGAMDLAAASDMVTDSMSALNIEATQDNLNNFADQLAVTASKSNTSVSQLGDAILTVGATASNLAGGTAELNTALGILADNGAKGAEGGTHLRNVILRLQSPTNKASAALGKYTNGVYDAQGNMRSLQDIMGELNKSMEGMTQAEKDAVMNDIFNKTDLASANALLANSGDRWNELSAAINDASGACQDMYDIQLDNLDGDIAKLQSGLSDLGISIYQDLNGPLREMTQLGTSMIEELSNAYEEGGMAGMVGAVGTCLSEVVDVIADYAPEVVSMGVTLIESFVEGIADNADKIADCAGEILTTFINGLFILIPEVLLAGVDIITGLADSIAAELPTLMENGTQAIVNFVDGIVQRLPIVIYTALNLVQSLTSSIAQNAPMLISAAITLIGNLVLGLISMLPQLLQMGIQLIISLVQGIMENLPLLLQMAVQIVIQLINGLVAMLPMVIQGGIQLIISLIQGIIQNLPVIIQSAVEIVMALITGLIQAIPMLIAAIPQLITAIVETIFTTDWLQVGMDILTGIKDGILNMASSLGSAVKDAVLGFFGLGGDSDDGAATSSGASTASSYASGITANSYMASDAMSSLSTNAFSSMDFTAATTAGTEGATAYTTGLTDSLSGFSLGNSTLDMSSFETTFATAGNESATAYTAGLSDSLSGFSFDASVIDTSSFENTFTTVGAEGITALSSGIASGASEVTTETKKLATDANKELSDGWNKAKENASNAMETLANTVKTKAQEAANAIKSAFESLQITIPKPKIPVITTTYKTENYGDGGNIKIPQFNVNWNALGGIFDGPTVMNTSQGLQGAGEAGPEALIPLDTLWQKMEGMFSKYSGTSLIDGLLEKLSSISQGNNQNQMEVAGTGMTVTYAPVFNVTGNASKEDIVEAEEMSQSKFAEMMEQWERDHDRKRF